MGLSALFCHRQPGQSFGPKLFDKGRQPIYLLATVMTASFGVKTSDHSASGYRAGEYFELAISHQVIDGF